YYLTDSAKSEGYIPCEKTISFPHKIQSGCESRGKVTPRYSAIGPTPFGNDMTIAVAKAAIEGEKLGQRGVTDFLGISFSSTDYCGHIFGPDSREEMDMVIRLDRQLDEFFKYLDKTVGFDNCLFYVSADHGVSPIPEQTSDGARLSSDKFIQFLKDKIDSRYPNVILGLHNDEVYLDSALINQMGYNVPEVEIAVGQASLTYPGVVAFYAKSFLLNNSNLDSLGRMVFNSTDRHRSGDVHLVLSQHTFFTSAATGTTHGSPYDYDTRVPVIITGKGIRPGRYGTKASVIDVFPTVSKLLDIQTTDRLGKVLSECLLPK
ncbi:MAG: alkaline phosphatase family protein, partial [Cytophagales bacterium]|nr:alkaline phosphatase family protein [Cytophagales bacterium]